VFFRRRAQDEPTGPVRGPGGGKVRPKPQQRRPRGRRPLRTSDYVFMAIVGFVLAFAATRLPVFHVSVTVSLVEAFAVAIASVAWAYWRESKRPRPEPPRKRRR
jgi:hypothetical protein